MNTFFEKLTGSRQPSAAPDPVSIPQRTRRAPEPALAAMRQEVREEPTRLRIDEEEHAASIVQAEPLEEEGELTVDIYDRGDSIVMQSTVAGVRPEDLDVSITNDTVSIRGRRERGDEVHNDSYYYKELFWGTFSRSVILPEEIEEDLAEASLKHGLLTLRLPKRKRGVVQKVKIKVI